MPLEEYERNMTSIIGYFASTDVLLVTPGAVVFDKVAGHKDDVSMIEYGRALDRVAQKVSSQRQRQGEGGKIAVVDMHDAFIQAAKGAEGGLASLLVEDGLHINEAGYEVSNTDSLPDQALLCYSHTKRAPLPRSSMQ